MTLQCPKCGSSENLVDYFERHKPICEPCRSKVTDNRVNGSMIKPKKLQKWIDMAEQKNSSIASKYNYAGDKV